MLESLSNVTACDGTVHRSGRNVTSLALGLAPLPPLALLPMDASLAIEAELVRLILLQGRKASCSRGKMCSKQAADETTDLNRTKRRQQLQSTEEQIAASTKMN